MRARVDTGVRGLGERSAWGREYMWQATRTSLVRKAVLLGEVTEVRAVKSVDSW